MCLDTVDKKPNCKSGMGYKLLQHGTGPSGNFMRCVEGTHPDVTIGKPVVDEVVDNFKSGMEPYTWYPSGFHIFKSMVGLRRFQQNFGWQGYHLCVVRVSYKDVVATGTQGYPSKSNVVVAREFTATKIIKQEVQHGRL